MEEREQGCLAERKQAKKGTNSSRRALLTSRIEASALDRRLSSLDTQASHPEGTKQGLCTHLKLLYMRDPSDN